MTGKFLTCIADGVSAGAVDEAHATRARETYEDAFAAASETLGPAEAERAAARAVIGDLEAAALRNKQLRTLATRSRREILANAGAFKRRRGYAGVTDLGKGGKPPKGGWVQGGEPPKEGPYRGGKAMADYLIELIDGQGGRAGAAGASVKGRYQALVGSYQAMMAEVIERFETKTGFDRPGRATLDNLVREAFGQDSGDGAAKILAKAWGETAEHARLTFNAAGGGIGKLEDWGLPQSHDPYAIRKAGKAAWVEAVAPRLDRGRMVDRVTGAPFSEKRLSGVLSDIYDSIITHGAIDREPGEPMGAGRLADRRSQARFLVFKDADNWMAYQQAFGAADPYAAMMGHLDGMARDTARLQVLGPNPEHQLQWLKRAAEREAELEEAAGADKALMNARHAIATADTMYGLFTGELSTPYGPNNMVAQVGQVVRSALAGIQLGSAVVNDLTSNPVFAAQTRAFTGLSKTGDFQAWAAWMATPQARATARRSGFILDTSRARLAGAARDWQRAQTVGGKVAAGLNAFWRTLPVSVMRAQGLSPNLTASRWAFQHEFMGALHDRRGMSLGEMATTGDAEDRAFAEVLLARGFSEADWTLIRSADPETPAHGASFLSPSAVAAAHGPELGWRVAEMIERQTRLAVPEPTLWAQAQLVGDSRPGTPWGELKRSLAAYRSFTVTQTYLWGREYAARAQAKPGWQLATAASAAPLVVSLTLAMAAGLQIKELIKGNDPRPMDEPEFWGAALLQGGGLGIFGDFLYAAQARNGKSSTLTALGSPAALASDLFDLTAGNAFQIGKAMGDPEDPASFDEAVDEATPGRDLARFLGRYNPLSSLWWTRTAFDRLGADQLQRLLDPDADDAFRRERRRLERDFEQGQWWPEGSPTPERAPQLVNPDR